jgi:hypothetical protein
LEEGVTALPDRVLDGVLDQLPATPQRRSWWPARRLREMNTPIRIAVAAAAVVAVAVVGFNFLPRQGGVGGPAASPSPNVSPSPSASNVLTEFPEGPLPAGTYVLAPFTPAGEGMCHVPAQSGCTETTADDTIRFTITVPAGWDAGGPWVLSGDNAPPGGAGLAFERGGWLLSDPCRVIDPDVPVGTTVASFVDAVAAHPILDTTKPIDVTLAGYSGKYFDLQVPTDISKCETDPGNPSTPVYRPWEPGIYAQGPAQRWHVWVLDVDGVRVLIQSSDFAGTSAQHQAELRAIVNSIQIQP